MPALVGRAVEVEERREGKDETRTMMRKEIWSRRRKRLQEGGGSKAEVLSAGGAQLYKFSDKLELPKVSE